MQHSTTLYGQSCHEEGVLLEIRPHLARLPGLLPLLLHALLTSIATSFHTCQPPQLRPGLSLTPQSDPPV
jgi:hypothetical protein